MASDTSQEEVNTPNISFGAKKSAAYEKKIVSTGLSRELRLSLRSRLIGRQASSPTVYSARPHLVRNTRSRAVAGGPT
eukprot:scaffold93707_cov32-Tisochrysis_lutea.AAC.1